MEHRDSSNAQSRAWLDFLEARKRIGRGAAPDSPPPAQCSDLDEEVSRFIEFCEKACVVRDPETGERKPLILTARQVQLVRLMLANGNTMGRIVEYPQR